MSERAYSRRSALAGLASILIPGIESPPRRAPLDQLVLVREFADNARLALSPPLFATLEGGDRRAFDRITFRPRVMRPTVDMDLGVTLFGRRHFAPIILGAFPEQGRYDPEGEIASARGAAAAQAGLVASSRSSVPIDRIAAAAGTPLWYEAGDGADSAGIRRAIDAGCQAVSLPLGADARAASGVPVLFRGILTPAEANKAIDHGAQGIIVSGHSDRGSAPILALPEVLRAVRGRVPVLVDSHFELGADALKCLAYGASAVLVSRPAMWGLAAYGSDGVMAVIEMLQAELARGCGMCGAATPAALQPELLRLHA